MGGLARLRGQRVYLDANLFIDAVENHPEHAEALDGGPAVGGAVGAA
jgi:hypothetical protein